MTPYTFQTESTLKHLANLERVFKNLTAIIVEATITPQRAF